LAAAVEQVEPVAAVAAKAAIKAAVVARDVLGPSFPADAVPETPLVVEAAPLAPFAAMFAQAAVAASVALMVFAIMVSWVVAAQASEDRMVIVQFAALSKIWRTVG